MIVCTYIYAETEGTKQLRKSAARFGHELAVLNVGPAPDAINAQLIALYKRAASGHKEFLYTDAADGFIQREITNIPDDHILYSTEKACYPHPSWASKHPASNSPWRFLNGGGVCGPLKLMIEYFERYKLAQVGSENGQAYLQQCFFNAVADGFPVKLDTDCKIFQTLAFADPSEFEWILNPEDGDYEWDTRNNCPVPMALKNKVTKTIPAVLHGNGLTEMKHIYERFKL